MRRRLAALLILVLGAAAGGFVVADRLPGASQSALDWAILPFRLGLDLQGGTHLLYTADFTNFRGGSRDEAMAGLRDVIERRVNAFGVSEPVVQVETAGDDRRLIVELAGVKDIREAIQLIGATPFLEFKEPRDAEATRSILEAQSRGQRLNEDPYFTSSELTGRYLERSELEFEPTTNTPVIGVTFDDAGSSLFEALTARSIGRPLGIYLDGVPLSAPVVQEKISGGKAQITGQFTPSEARDLVRRLNSGALPVPITLTNQQSVEASFGRESLERSFTAAIIGLIAVAVFMVIWYRLPGLIAVVALLVYAALVLAIFKLIPVTLTAAGIAGFVLSLGMAVDANILIFERMKEELGRGRAMGDALAEGFSRAWTSIRDSNVSSLITAAILYWFGTSVVKGFALTLGIGVLVSMFSAITVSRTFLLAVVTPGLARYRSLFSSGFGLRRVHS